MFGQGFESPQLHKKLSPANQKFVGLFFAAEPWPDNCARRINTPHMSSTKWIYAILFIALLSFQSCAVVGGIFKAGIWVGVVAVILVVLLIIFIVSKASGKK